MSNHQKEIIKCNNAYCEFWIGEECRYKGSASISPNTPHCKACEPYDKPPSKEDLRKAKERQEAYDKRWYYLYG